MAFQPGDTIDAVVEEIGPPHSYVVGEDRTVFHYERGRVEFTNGVVESVEWLRPSQLVDARPRIRREAVQRPVPELDAVETATDAPDTRALQQALSLAVDRLRDETRRLEEARKDADRAALRQQLWELERQAREARLESAWAREQAALAQILALDAQQNNAKQPTESPEFDDWGYVTWYDAGRVCRNPPPRPPVQPKSAPWGRWSVEQRLGPQGRPVFGGRRGALASSP